MRAPAWRRMYAASSAFSMKLIGTSTAPMRAMRKAQRRERVRVARQDRDAVALADALRGQAGGDALADGMNSR